MTRSGSALALTLAVTAGACACGRKQAASARDAGAPAVPAPPLGLDGGPPDEPAVRSGRRSGMAGDLPEVATEPLIEALVAGRTPWSRVVDPRLGVVELRLAPGEPPVVRLGRRCGAELERILAEHAALIAASLARTELGYALACDNLALALPDPDGALPHAICSVESPDAYAADLDLVFLPDPALGLRLAGVSVVEGEADAARMDAFGAELARGAGDGARCP